jgi:GTP-binding protein
MFIDEVIIHIKAGDGGNGCIAFRREKYVPKGGPDGGDGGDGGSVIIVADPQKATLLDFKNKITHKAERGEHGKGKNKHGKNGKDIVLKVPLGTIIYDRETNAQLFDLTTPNEKVVIAAGGKGGKGNKRFATSTNRAASAWSRAPER